MGNVTPDLLPVLTRTILLKVSTLADPFEFVLTVNSVGELTSCRYRMVIKREVYLLVAAHYFAMSHILNLLLLGSLTLASAINVSLPSNTPSNAQPLLQTLISFSIEQDRWPDWTGINSRNPFTYQALKNLADLTGVPPKIRVGADSEDHTVWSPTVTVRYLTTIGFAEYIFGDVVLLCGP